MDRKTTRKRTMTMSGSLVSLKKLENKQLKQSFLNDDVIALDNVKNMVEMMQGVDNSLNSKYVKHKAGMQRSVEIKDAQNDLSNQIKIASQIA